MVQDSVDDSGRSFADHFSAHAGIYASHRPHYPARLFAWLAERAPSRGLAWDVGCGNGQAARALAEHFDRVVASDPSAEQIAMAPPHPRIDYRVEPAEHCSLESTSVDLVTVAQALHWFEPTGFHAEVARVLRPGGLLAVWCYGLCRVSPEVDALYDRLYHQILADDWPPEREHVESGYRNLPFPWAEPWPTPDFPMHAAWRLSDYLGYLASWSACQRHLRRRGRDPVADLAAELEAAWGDPQRRREVVFPLQLRVGCSGLPASY